jgi:hypothetical protein
MFDRAKWNEERKATEAQIRTLKGAQRESHQPRWSGWRDGPALIALKREATLLYAARARTHRRRHAIAWEEFPYGPTGAATPAGSREEAILKTLARFTKAQEEASQPHAA